MQLTFSKNHIFKTIISLFLLLSSFAIFSAALPASLKGNLGMEAGDYKFESFDVGKLQENYLNKFRDAQSEQYKFVVEKIMSLNDNFSYFVSDTINGPNGIQTLADMQAETGEPIEVKYYMASRREYNTQKELIENLVKSITIIPGAIRGKEALQAKGSGLVDLPNLVDGKSIDFTELTNHYKLQLERLHTQVLALKFNLNTARGLVVNKNILYVPKITLKPEVIAKMRLKANRDKKMNSREKEALENYGFFTQRTSNSFTTAYGDMMQYRLNTDDVKQAKNLRLIENIQSIYWSRSYQRATYGLALGTFKIDYTISKFHTDNIFTDTKDLLNFVNTIEFDQSKMIIDERKLTEAIRTAELRSLEFLPPGTDMQAAKASSKVNVLSTIASAMTWLKGKSQMAAVNLAVLRLVQNDIFEEIMILSPGGLRKMTAHYKEYYYNTPAREKYFTGLRDELFPEEDDLYGDVGANLGANSLSGQISVISAILDNWNTRIWNAKEIDAEIEAAESDNKVRKNLKKRRRI